MSEKQIPWSQVVESDQVQSKDGRWFGIDSIRQRGAKVVAHLSGVNKPVIVGPDESVMVKRGGTGAAVDVFLDVFYSGPAR